MDIHELEQLLNGHEWADVEFKEARTAVPPAIYKSVSAFSNTEGGWVVFGVKDDAGRFEVVGVLELDKVQGEFITVLRSGDKLSRIIELEPSLIQHDNGPVLAFYIPEARRQDKPVHLNSELKQSYIRRGASDIKCSEEELKRLIRDSSDTSPDRSTVDLSLERCFDADSLAWYRREFNQRDSRYEGLPDIAFLNNWGLVVEESGQLRPTLASIMLFGSDAAVRQTLPRPVVDMRWIDAAWDEELPDERWSDRVVAEENLIKSWRILIEGFRKNSPDRFEIDPATLQRTNATPDYITFREAAINLLLHQDYLDHARKPTIKFFRDVWVFWNPGDSFSTNEELLLPGDKPARNQLIVSAFRRIGLSEQAGTGLREIQRSWRRLGFDRPKFNNDRSRKSFEVSTPRWALVSDEQLIFQAALGVDLSEDEASTFALAVRTGHLDLIGVNSVTGLMRTDAQFVISRLILQGLVTPIRQGNNDQVQLTDAMRERFANPSELMLEQQWQIVDLCDVPQALSNLMIETKSNLTKQRFRRTLLVPLLEGGIIKMTHPETLSHPSQKYVLTKIGVDLKARRLKRKNDEDSGT